MDDTLYLERDYVYSGFQAVGKYLSSEYEICGFADQAWDLFLDGNRGDIFDQCLGKLNLSGSSPSTSELVEIYRNHKPQISLEFDAKQMFGCIRTDLSLGLITDGPQESQFAKIQALGIDTLIEHIIVTDAKGKEWSKPNERAFLYLQQLTGNTGDECVYIADNPAKDFIAPLALGWQTVMVNRPGSLYSQQSEGTPAAQTISDLSSKSLDSISLDITNS